MPSGGQSDEPISDYNPANPSLWQSESNKDLLVMIWRKIAERYKDKTWIGGYDLINEPKWELLPNNQPLRDLYIRLTDTIRAVDTNHILFIEAIGLQQILMACFHPGMKICLIVFHKYWNGNNTSSIQYLLDLRNNTNIPLWLGETGENSNQWFVDCIELMKNNNIGWAWWSHKKISSIAGLFLQLFSQHIKTYLITGLTAAHLNIKYSLSLLLLAQAEMLKIEKL
ncbi:MAG: cellulase family glycosylhydrolase [Ignavibacteriales bacterium]|nr:cellulase family glycosylhydrolase [Ignavibacteriales bacterium]